MFLRTKNKLYNLDTAISIGISEYGTFADNPVISVRNTDGKFREIECETLAQAEKKRDEIQEALQAGVPVFDMR